ncbi:MULTISPECIES: flagellar protein FlaG [unclassified Pseudoalteromonas]|uniref:flagellar protein FlaG n=1 Tax=unclassified Pseudoalteromonas TaxID=194690 RepID=UPI00257FCD75|nr:flagellar protein FlaG [Pseudoalteromonas sp. UBA2102]|tara:strand:+ start:2202 stop:2603 length:402 start_codon:yes stop_codon:yes gene_type:complete
MENINSNLSNDAFAKRINSEVTQEQKEFVAEQVNALKNLDESQQSESGEDIVAQNLLNSVEKLESLTQLKSKQFKFHIDEQTSSPVVVVTDTATDEVIRQIPSLEVLELASKIDELQEQIFGQPLGVLIDKTI